MLRLVLAVVTATLAANGAFADEAEDKAAAILSNSKSSGRYGELTRDTGKPGKPVIRVRLIRFGSDDSLTTGDVELLSAFKSLTALDLKGVRVGDELMKPLAKLTTLKELVLFESEVTDAGLMELAALKNLTSLSLQRTRVTAKGVAALQKALPKCDIRRQ
jgi:hypothetical protein